MDHWSVYLEYGAPDVGDDVHDRILDALVGHHPNTTTSPAGNLGVIVSLASPTAEQAVAEALRLVGDAVRAAHGSAAVLGIEVLTEQEQQRRNASPSVPDIVGPGEIARLLDISASRTSQVLQSKQWKKNVPEVTNIGRLPVFLLSDVLHFRDHIRTGAPGRPAKTQQ